jgi:hypothetical protein
MCGIYSIYDEMRIAYTYNFKFNFNKTVVHKAETKKKGNPDLDGRTVLKK